MVSGKVFTVEAKSDFLARQASAPPLMALAEFVWNSLDADAMRVDVEFEKRPLGLERIIVRDDGTGMAYDDAPACSRTLAAAGRRWLQAPRAGDGSCMAVKGRAGSRLSLLGGSPTGM